VGAAVGAVTAVSDARLLPFRYARCQAAGGADEAALLARGEAAERAGALAEARACFLDAWQRARDGGPRAERSLARGLAAQLALLQSLRRGEAVSAGWVATATAPATAAAAVAPSAAVALSSSGGGDGDDEDDAAAATEAAAAAAFAATWAELLGLMQKNQLQLRVEFDALAGPYEVLLLHGQLACLASRTLGAVRSIAAAAVLAERRVSDATHWSLFEMLARIELGRGHAAEALGLVAEARRLAPADLEVFELAPVVMLQLQAALALHGDAHAREFRELREAREARRGVVATAAVSAGSGAGEAAGGVDETVTALLRRVAAAAEAAGATAGSAGEGAGKGVAARTQQQLPPPQSPTAPASLDEIWEDVRAIVLGRLRRLGASAKQLGPADPLVRYGRRRKGKGKRAPRGTEGRGRGAAAAAAAASEGEGDLEGDALRESESDDDLHFEELRARGAAGAHEAAWSLELRAPRPGSAWMQLTVGGGAGGGAAAEAAFRAGGAGYAVLRGVLPRPYFAALRRRHERIFFPHGTSAAALVAAARSGVATPGLPGSASGGAQDHSDVVMDAAQNRRTLWGEELSLFAGLRLLPAVQRLVGRPLRLVYAFSIAYAAGGDLKPHKDRPQNAYSMSLNLGLVGGEGADELEGGGDGGGGGGGGGDEDADAELALAQADAEEGALAAAPRAAAAASASARRGDPSPPWPLWVVPVGRNESAATAARMRPNDALLYQGPLSTHFRKPLGAGLASMQVIFGFRDVDEAHCNSQ